MKHDQIPEMAAERYLMNELPAADREAFKEHFSDCAVCATQMRAGFAIREQVLTPRAVPDPMPGPQPRPIRWLRRVKEAAMPMAASFLIATAGMYVGVVRPLMQPGVGSSANLLMVRGDDQQSVENSRGPAVLNVAIYGDGRSTPYIYTITGAAQRTLHSGKVGAEQVNAATEFVPIVIPRRTLAPGEYALRIDTKPRISTYLFTVRSD